MTPIVVCSADEKCLPVMAASVQATGTAWGTSLADPLTATHGGTGLSSSGSSGNVLTSNGSGWVSSVPAGGGTGSNLYLYVNNGGF